LTQALHAAHAVLHAAMWFCFYKAREDTGALRKHAEEYEANLRTLAHSRYPSAQPAATLELCHVCRLVRPKHRPVKHCSLCMQCIPGQVGRPFALRTRRALGVGGFTTPRECVELREGGVGGFTTPRERERVELNVRRVWVCRRTTTAR
jgi:hypothetical protein